jgi:hypothetical protein
VRGEGLLAARSYIQPGFSALQSIKRAFDIDGRVTARETLLSAFFRFACTVYVDFVRTFGGFGENRDFGRQHFGKSPRDREPLLLTARTGVLAVSDFTDGQLRDQRSVPRQNAEIPVLTGNLNFFGRRVDDFLFRGDDFELESVCQFQYPVLSNEYPVQAGICWQLGTGN